MKILRLDITKSIVSVLSESTGCWIHRDVGQKPCPKTTIDHVYSNQISECSSSYSPLLKVCPKNKTTFVY